MYYSMTNGKIIAAVNANGAELISLCDTEQNNKEYIWFGKEEFWKGQAPVMFPFCGKLLNGKYTYKSVEYPFDRRHGFARNMKFELVAHSETSMTFAIHSNAETKALYPFDFEFRVEYAFFGEKGLKITYTVMNLDENEMIFAIGSHPGFNVPLNEGEKFEDYYLEFDSPCEPKRTELNEGGFVTGNKLEYPLLNGKVLPLMHNLFDEDAVFLTETSKGVTLKSNVGKNGLHFTFDGFDSVGFWHTNKTEAPFLCIEPWNGHSANIRETLPLEEKEDMIRLPAGKSYTVGFGIEIF